MLGLLRNRPAEQRYTLDDYSAWVSDLYGYNNGYGFLPGYTTTYPPGENREPVATDFTSHVRSVYKRNGPVAALVQFRMDLFSQVRWSFQRLRSGQPGDLFSLPELDVVNNDPLLNTWMILDRDLAGNFYGVRDGDRVRRLRPDWVQVIGDGPLDEYDTDIAGYAYFTGGAAGKELDDAELFLPEQVIHWMPQPDPEARWRGMSWLTPIVREVAADNAATSHKLKFFENAATPNLAVKLDKDVSLETFLKFKDQMDDSHAGTRNAYKTLYLGGGADVSVIGADMRQIEFSVTQGKGESRLASAARVPAVLVGFSEGLQAATYSNFMQARFQAADGLLHPLWVSAAAALGKVIQTPSDARFWYSANDIPFLREDSKDVAAIKQQEAATIRTLIDAGYKPDTVVDAVKNNDWTRLTHTGLFSVQLQPAGSTPAVDTASRAVRIVRDENGIAVGIEPGSSEAGSSEPA